jgi:hypothetical protein
VNQTSATTKWCGKRFDDGVFHDRVLAISAPPAKKSFTCSFF